MVMEERTSDTAETFSSQPPPGDPSGQNAEESDAPTGGDPQANRHPSNPQTEDGREGGAGEDSQATGNPNSAG
jgi:hypothetical protein